MTNFETLLLQSGSPDLICAYVNEHEKLLSKDFMRNFEIYSEEAEKKMKTTIHHNPFSMEVDEFLEIYGRGILSVTIRTRIYNCVRSYFLGSDYDIYRPTVYHLLKIKKSELKHFRNFGPKSITQLEKVLTKAGLKLQD